MGTTKDAAGLSVQFYDEQDAPTGPPVYGKYVELFGMSRNDVIDDNAPPTVEEFREPGSFDWLTHVIVADTRDALDEFLRTYDGPRTGPNTSASSRRTTVVLLINGQLQRFPNRTTIASGPVVSVDPPMMDVVHVKVMHERSVMDDDHPLIHEFRGGSPFMRFLSSLPAPGKAG